MLFLHENNQHFLTCVFLFHSKCTSTLSPLLVNMGSAEVCPATVSARACVHSCCRCVFRSVHSWRTGAYAPRPFRAAEFGYGLHHLVSRVCVMHVQGGERLSCVPDQWFSHIHVDLVGPWLPNQRGNTHLLTVINRATSWFFCARCPGASSPGGWPLWRTAHHHHRPRDIFHQQDVGGLVTRPPRPTHLYNCLFSAVQRNGGEVASTVDGDPAPAEGPW